MKINIIFFFFLFGVNTCLYSQVSLIEKHNFEIITGCKVNEQIELTDVIIDSSFVYKLHFGELKKLDLIRTETLRYNRLGFPIIVNNSFQFQEGSNSTYYVYDISCIKEINYDSIGKNIVSLKAYSNNSFLTEVGDFLIKLKYVNGRVIQKDVYCLDGRCDEGDLINSYTYKYDNLGRIIQCNNVKRRIVTDYSYNNLGYLEKVYRYRINNDKGNHIPKQLPRYKRIIKYDNNGRVISNRAYINEYENDLYFSEYKSTLKENLSIIENKWQEIEDKKDEIGNDLGNFEYPNTNSKIWSTRVVYRFDDKKQKIYEKIVSRNYINKN